MIAPPSLGAPGLVAIAGSPLKAGVASAAEMSSELMAGLDVELFACTDPSEIGFSAACPVADGLVVASLDGMISMLAMRLVAV